jgi:putative flippase GtrA
MLSFIPGDPRYRQMNDFVIVRQAKRFLVSGLLVTGLHILVAASFIHLALLIPALANGIAFIVATVFSYLINTLWSFSQPLYGRNLIRFLTVSLLGCLLAVAVSATVDFYNMHYLMGIACVTITVPPITFFLHKVWTYQ